MHLKRPWTLFSQQVSSLLEEKFRKVSNRFRVLSVRINLHHLILLQKHRHEAAEFTSSATMLTVNGSSIHEALCKDEYRLSGIRKRSVTVRLPAPSVPCTCTSVQHDTDINKKQEMVVGGAPKIPQWTTSALSHINLRRSDSWSPLWKAFGERLAHANYRD